MADTEKELRAVLNDIHDVAASILAGTHDTSDSETILKIARGLEDIIHISRYAEMYSCNIEEKYHVESNLRRLREDF